MTEMALSEPSATRRGLISVVADELLLLILAGIPVGVLLIGVGSRLAMLLLRVTSDTTVIGVESDDGFTIGDVTLSGTYNLLLLGAAVGVIGAAAYQWVRPWLLGPRWFRYLTIALAVGAVVGSMLVHADGIDFRLLTPTWLAIGSFVALPAVFGVAIAATVDRLDRPGSWITAGRPRWVVAIALVVMFPLTLLVLAFSLAVLLAWVPMRQSLSELGYAVPSQRTTLAMRCLWMGIAVLGLITLVNDIREISAVT